jgi:hypothetical protein
MEIKSLIDHRTFILGETPHKNELIIPVKLVLKAKQTATGKLDKLKARVVARASRNVASRKQTLPTNNMSFSYAKTLLTALRLTNPTFNQLTYLNFLKTPGPPVHLQEGSNSSYPPLVQHAALLKVLTSSVPTSKPKSLAATL